MLKINRIVKKYWGYNELKDKQIDAIKACIDNIDTLVLLPTGYGKSMCYLIPPLVTKKIMLIVSPLISLMEDQKEKLIKMKIPVATLHCNNNDRSSEIDLILAGKISIVYCSPEYFVSNDMSIVRQFIDSERFGYLAIDECHCVSQWGHDFRDSYLKLNLFRKEFPSIPIMALTATANKNVADDIILNLMMRDPVIVTTNFDRPNLYLKCVELIEGSIENTFKMIEPYLAKYKDDKMIIYVNKRSGCEDLQDIINCNKYKSMAYHAGLSKQDRDTVQTMFTNSLNIIVSTVAFGMGIDLTIRCVLIVGAPNSVEDYYQQIGRAGRDGYLAETVMFFQYKNIMIAKKMNRTKFNKNEQSENNSLLLKTKDNNLTKMGKYFFSQICRRRFILEYFDQIPKFFHCTNCDNCCERKLIDYTDRVKQCVFNKMKFTNIFNSIELDKMVECQLLYKNGENYSYGKSLENWIKLLTINKKIDCIPDKYKILL